MNLENLLTDKRSAILHQWQDAIIATYPTDAQRFFKKEKDCFSNPVGHTIANEMEILYDELIGTWNTARVASSLDSINRIRAVQDLKPSQAIGFVLQLRNIMRETVGEIHADKPSGGLRALEKRIDEMSLMAFDSYSQCRQKVSDLKVNEFKRQVSRLLQRANLVSEIPDWESDLADKKTDRVN